MSEEQPTTGQTPPAPSTLSGETLPTGGPLDFTQSWAASSGSLEHPSSAFGEREQRYRRLLAAANDYIFTVVVEDGKSVATTHGPGCAAVTGYTAKEFESDHDLWYRVIYEEDRPVVLAQIARVLTGETPPALEHRILHKDGRVRWIRNISVPHIGRDGKLVAYDGLISDITARKQAEQILVLQHNVTVDLSEAETLGDALRRVLKTLCQSFLWEMAAFWRLDAQEKVLRCGEAWHVRSARLEKFALLNQSVTIAPGSELPGTVWNSAKPKWLPDLREDKESQRIAQAQKAGLRGACAFPIRRKREVVGVIELFSREVQAQDKHMLQALSAVGAQIGHFIERKQADEALKKTLADLAASHEELKSMQLELIQSAKMESLGTLAAGIAHEVKNPLATVVMGVEFLAGEVPASNAAAQETLTIMKEAVRRADTIIRDMLRLAASTKLEIKAEQVNAVAEQALTLVSYQLKAAGIEVIREMAPALPRVLLDRMKMEQVFINLFINAMQAMPQGGKLTVRTRVAPWNPVFLRSPNLQSPLTPGEPVVVVEVQDTGIGIPEENLSRVSEPFFTTKPAGVGTGLGLSVIKKIVDLHNGEMDIRNAPERGVRASLYLRPEQVG